MNSNDSDRYYFRFSLGQRYLHGLVIVTFLGLAATGMTLRFSERGWARWLAEITGGFTAVLSLHKLCAVLISARLPLPCWRDPLQGDHKEGAGRFLGAKLDDPAAQGRRGPF